MTAPPTDELDDVDGERPDEPFVVHVAGRTVVFRPAAGPAWRELLEALAWPPAFMATYGPDDPDDVAAVESLSVTQVRVLLRRWRIHHGLSARDQDHLRLVGMLAKPAYRAAAERDLRETQQLDLTTEWQARRWRRLLNMLDGLPRTSHVHDVMSQDDELAELYLDRETDQGPARAPRRTLREFTVEAELLSHAVDRLGELLQAHATGKGATRRRVEPMPRPETAIQRAKERRVRRKHKYTVARVFGYIDEKGRPTGKGPVPEGTPLTP